MGLTMMLERGRRASLAITLNFVALAFGLSAVTTNFWCAGTRKVIKPFCPFIVTARQVFCLRLDISDNNTGVVPYQWEAGEDKFLMRKFHTGLFLSCEQAEDFQGWVCRDFSGIAPEDERGVLWLCIAAEILYLALLFTGGAMLILEQCPCFNVINKLKLNAFAAMCIALSGLCGMLANMMFSTIYQIAVINGPEDWKPNYWDYSWSFALAWCSFGTCMGSAATALNRYTKTMAEFKHHRRNIEKKLRIKQNLMKLERQDQMWNSLVGTDTPLALSANGHKPPHETTYLVDMDNLPESQGEEYC